MSLRDELVQRLADVAKSAEVKEGADGIYGKIANEVIRQMEWARRHCVEIYIPDYDEAELNIDVDLTTAPPDWKP